MVNWLVSCQREKYEHRNNAKKISILPSTGAAAPGVWYTSAIIAQKIGCIRSTSDSVNFNRSYLLTDTCSVLDSGVIPVSDQISDHKATYVSLKIQTDLSNSYYRDIWNYKNADNNQLNNFIFQFDWDSVINDNVTVNDACNKFTSIFFEFCKECIPRKKVLIRPNDKPWFNSELRYNIRLRDRLRKKTFKTNHNFDKIRLVGRLFWA